MTVGERRVLSATAGGYFWWAYAVYFAVAALWSVWPAIVAFLAVSALMRAIYYFSRSGDILDSIAAVVILVALLGLGLGVWRSYEHGQLVWFLLLIPGVLVADAVSAALFYATVGIQ